MCLNWLKTAMLFNTDVLFILFKLRRKFSHVAQDRTVL